MFGVFYCLQDSDVHATSGVLFLAHCFLRVLFLRGITEEYIMQALKANFLGQEITLVDHNGVAYVAMREVVVGIGLEWARQAQKSTRKIQLCTYAYNWERREKIRNALYAN